MVKTTTTIGERSNLQDFPFAATKPLLCAPHRRFVLFHAYRNKALLHNFLNLKFSLTSCLSTISALLGCLVIKMYSLPRRVSLFTSSYLKGIEDRISILLSPCWFFSFEVPCYFRLACKVAIARNIIHCINLNKITKKI